MVVVDDNEEKDQFVRMLVFNLWLVINCWYFVDATFNRLWWYQKPIGFAKPSECLWQCWWSSRPSSPCHWQVLSTWPFWPQNNSQNPTHRCCVVRQLWEGGMNYSGWGQNNPSICQHQSLFCSSCTNMTTSVNPPFPNSLRRKFKAGMLPCYINMFAIANDKIGAKFQS